MAKLNKRIITAEQREKYNQRRKERYHLQKEERRREKETQTHTWRKLSFLKGIMQQRNISQRELARRLKTSPQAVNQMFVVTDDADLKKIKQILNACGCSCSVDLLPIKKEALQKQALYEFKGDIELDEISVPADFIHYPDSIFYCPPEANLRFLSDFIIGTNLSVSEFSRKVNLSRQSITYAFDVDNIKLSILCQIASRMNAKIEWNINALDNQSGEAS